MFEAVRLHGCVVLQDYHPEVAFLVWGYRSMKHLRGGQGGGGPGGKPESRLSASVWGYRSMRHSAAARAAAVLGASLSRLITSSSKASMPLLAIVS